MHQDLLVDVLIRKLQEVVLTSANVERLRRALKRQVEQQRATSAVDADGLRQQLHELNREIDQASENFLRAPSAGYGA